MSSLLCHRVFGVLPHLGGPECEDDVGFGNARPYEFWRDTVLRVVGLDPQFAVNDVHVRERMMNALVAVPAESHKYEAAAWTIKDRLAGYGPFQYFCNSAID